MSVEAGADVHEHRVRRRWSMRELGERSGLTAAAIQRLEAGEQGGLASYARIATALGLRPQLRLTDERRQGPIRAADPVHSLMGNVEAEILQRRAFPVALDEPYQHYQFAGRADVVAWSLERRALLHIENRTRFPDLQESFGSYNAKRTYLAPALAERLRIPGGWAAVTHAIVALWSAEVLHVLRLRTASFRAVCPDPPDALLAWLAGSAPNAGVTSTLLILDPIAAPRRRRWIGIEDALRAEPRYRGHAEAAAAIGATS